MNETLFLWLWAPFAIGFVIVAVRLMEFWADRRHRKRHHPAE
ncbi:MULTISPECIES: hypothetical protein [unclassified Devosia]|nr:MULTISPECIES: hypothetical protein [unclassified Devosia]